MNYYLLMHFDGYAVTGMVVLDQPDPESARKAAIWQLNKVIARMRKQFPTDQYGHVKRHRSFRRTLCKPWRYAVRSWLGQVEKIYMNLYLKSCNYLKVLQCIQDIG